MSLGEVIREIRPGRTPVASIDCSPDSRMLAVGQWSSNEEYPTLSLIDPETGETVRVIENGDAVWKVKFDKTGSRLTYIHQLSREGKFELVSHDLGSGEKRTIKEVEELVDIIGYTINPANGLLVCTGTGDTLECWDLNAPESVMTISMKDSLKRVSLDAPIVISCSHDGKYVALGGMAEGGVFLYGTGNYEKIREFQAPFNYPGQIAFDRKGEYMVVPDFWQKGIFIWNPETGERHLDDDFGEFKTRVSCGVNPWIETEE